MGGLNPEGLCAPTNQLDRPNVVDPCTKSAATQLQAVVTISGPSDLTRTGGEMRIDRPSPVTALVGGDVSRLRAAGPVAHVNAGAPPYLIIHGTADSVIDQIQSFAADIGMTYLMAAPLSGRTFRLLTDSVVPRITS